MHASVTSSQGIGARLKRARQRSGLTQDQLAERLSSHQSTICRVENGQKPRNKLHDKLIDFIQGANEARSHQPDAIVDAVAKSNEFRALVTRILDEA